MPHQPTGGRSVRRYLGGLLPSRLAIWGYARSANTNEKFRAGLRSWLEPHAGKRLDDLEKFLGLLYYTSGQYGSDEDFGRLGAEITAWEGAGLLPATKVRTPGCSSG